MKQDWSDSLFNWPGINIQWAKYQASKEHSVVSLWVPRFCTPSTQHMADHKLSQPETAMPGVA